MIGGASLFWPSRKAKSGNIMIGGDLNIGISERHHNDFGAATNVLATLAILDAQVSRHQDLPRTIDGLHEQCTDPKALDLRGMFGRCEEGTIVFIRGKHKGRSLDDIAQTKPDYLQWMLRDDYFDDTKSIASEALKQAG